MAAGSGTPGGCPWRTASLEPPCAHSVRTALHIVLGAGDTTVRKGLTRSLSTWGSQSNGEGDGQSPFPSGTLGGLGRQDKNDLAERRIGGVGKTDSGRRLNVLSAPGGQDGSSKPLLRPILLPGGP